MKATDMKATIKIGYNNVVGTISPELYGSGFESYAGSVSLGLEAEMLEGRNFQEQDVNEDGISDKWRPVGPGERTVQYSLDGKRAFRGERTQRIAGITSQNAGNGIEQGGKYIKKGEKYIASLYLRQERLEKDAVVKIYLANGKDVCAEAIIEKVTNHWAKYTVSLVPNVTSTKASFVIALYGKGTLWVDQVSMVPEHTYKEHNTRTDIVEAIVDLGPTLIRWPGGWAAEVYCWKDGIGDPEKRPVTKKHHSAIRWRNNPSWEANSFGTDEFIQFCRDINAEPVMVVKSGYEEKGLDLEEYITEALEWLEYCNGTANSQFGAMRAANGHPEPYGVRYWNIGNEPWEMDAAEYGKRVVRIGRAMKEKDPSIKIFAAGAHGYERNWNLAVMRAAKGHFDYLDLHYYFSCENYLTAMAEPMKYAEFIKEMNEEMAAFPAERPAKVSILEWNSNSTWLDASKLKEGLYTASFLNMLERQGNDLTQSIIWPLLRKVQPSGNHASNHSLIWYDNHRIFLSPTALALKLYRSHYAPEQFACEVKCDTIEVPDGGDQMPLLDVVATGNSADGTVIIKVVNKDPVNSIKASMLLEGAPERGGRLEAKFSTLTGPDVNAQNDLDNPDVVKIVETTSSVAPNDFTHVFAPHSVTAIKLSKMQE